MEDYQIKLSFFCDVCERMDINIDCKRCLKIKAEHYNEHLKHIHEIVDGIKYHNRFMMDMENVRMDYMNSKCTCGVSNDDFSEWLKTQTKEKE